ncbi:endomucin isoform X2 [Tamandua tetradactyla]|uniref:endomucin isoform X2 n=1 Tax=Tamandua tetradactyla TaxID=48850 RepID=UPI004053D7E8
MKVLQVNILFLLLSSICCSEKNSDVGNTSIPVLSSTRILTTQEAASIKPSADLVTQPILGASSEGPTKSEFLKISLLPTTSSLTTTVKDEGSTATDATKNEFIMTNSTVANSLLTNAVSTLKSSQHKSVNQSSMKTTERPVTIQPDASPYKTTTLPSISASENISPSQGTGNGKNASASSTNPSYSSIILPVVIALIVITLSVFVLVGLYRMCRKTDPGTPENGNDQPQSDKESVKLLTVKTISHESGEHLAQGKTKN